MSVIQSDWGLGKKSAPVSCEANGVVTERFVFTVDDDLAAGDIIELAVLPAYHYPVDAVLDFDKLAGTADVGIMSGSVGVPDDARTCGDELFSAENVATAAAVVRTSAADAFRIEPTDTDRSIGVKVSAAVTATGQRVSLILSYVQ